MNNYMSEEQNRDREILNELKRISDFEFQRWGALEGKAMHVATSTGAILALFYGLITYSPSYLSNINFTTKIFHISAIALISIMFLLSILFSFQVLKTRKFFSTNSELLVQEYPSRDFSEYLEYYRNDLRNNNMINSTTNARKARALNHSIFGLCLGILSLVLYSITVIFIVS